MRTKKQIQPGEKVPLKLTAAQRKLVLEGLMCLDQDFEEIIRETQSGKPVMMTLDDLDGLGGYIAAEANHCDDTKKQRKLDTVFQKIQNLLSEHTDEEPRTTINVEDTRKAEMISDQAAKTKQAGDTKRSTRATTGKLFQFKFTLLGTEPPIWRRIHIQDCKLDKLHEHIQTAMGWTNSHLHEFEIKGERYGDPELLDDGFEDVECIDSTQTMVSDIIPKSGKRFAFKYLYDFGDCWEHEILFEGCPPMEEATKYPVCMEGERACPPEDVGGVWGYQDFLAASADPKHKEHESYLEWCGASFAPDEFDPKQATKEMKKGLPDWRNM